MNKFKLSNRTKKILTVTSTCAGAAAISMIKDQKCMIDELNNTMDYLRNIITNDLIYQMNLESFIVDNLDIEPNKIQYVLYNN